MDYSHLLPPWVWIGSAAILGLIVGSFLNVVVHRLPKILFLHWDSEARNILRLDESDRTADGKNTDTTPQSCVYHLHWPPSHCPHCYKTLKARENIPLLSYLLQKGKCRGCSQPISLRYPTLELLSAAAAAAVVAVCGATTEAAVILAVTWTLLAAAAIDYQHYLLPDCLTIPLLWAGLLWSAVAPSAATAPSPEAAILGAVIGYLSLWLIYQGHRLLTGREGMGYGDFKITAALGAWLGWQALPMLVLLAASAGLVLALALALRSRPLHNAMPFGPMLAAAGWYLLVFGDPIGFWPQIY
ncbi:A24 family peptidase [Halorhodospira halochloris]|uniref:Prepilin leader peptidase/N-methyltransferase n=1 Tax=Halorhodospira halochloris TaxID=1052 RepID=A0A110B794_HALHR|nr:A24 family peptidase [Halorhodospira halochloris]MBK1652144.1 prepilin peptidase [Halorhodospira halochloris]MCG5530572.1 A24 family peptidase [Halorhodospira halochloris]BAU58438.1 leader peptidase [Halorhodospira halochloris]